jgi:hypothetical protein
VLQDGAVIEWDDETEGNRHRAVIIEPMAHLAIAVWRVVGILYGDAPLPSRLPRNGMSSIR